MGMSRGGLIRDGGSRSGIINLGSLVVLLISKSHLFYLLGGTG